MEPYEVYWSSQVLLCTFVQRTIDRERESGHCHKTLQTSKSSAESGAESGTESGANSSAESSAESGAESGAKSSAESGAESLSLPGPIRVIAGASQSDTTRST